MKVHFGWLIGIVMTGAGLCWFAALLVIVGAQQVWSFLRYIVPGAGH